MVLPLLTTAVAAAFALFVLAQWVRKRKPYQLVWGIGLLMFAVAAGAGFVARSSGVAEADYRVFYLFGAILNVAWLALGTVYLLAPRGAANVALIVVILFSLLSAFVVFSTPVDVAAAGDTGRGFMDAPPRVLAGIGSGVGSVVLVLGALWSAWAFMRRNHQGRRAVANVVIAVGVLIVAAGGTVAFTGASGILETTNLVGIAVMFAGFLLV